MRRAFGWVLALAAIAVAVLYALYGSFILWLYYHLKPN